MADDTQGLPAGDAGQGDGAGADSGNVQDGNQGDNGQGATQGQQNAGDANNGDNGQGAQPPPLSPEELIQRAADAGFQKTASWLGRRDKELLEQVGNLINARLPAQPQQPTPPPSGNIDAATLLEKPQEVFSQFVRREDIPRILAETNQQQTQAQQNYNTTLIQQAGELMEADPLFADKELGAETVAEIQKGFATLDRRLPPNVAAQLLVHGAVANVIRKRAATKTNAFAGKAPLGKGQGTVGTPGTGMSRPKIVKLSPDAQKLKERFGYSDADLAKIPGFVEGS